MRTVTFGGANSLDNFFARPDGGVDWLLWDDEVSAILADYWQRIDTVVMGRKTYEAAVAAGGGGNPYGGMKSYVCSRTMAALPDDSIEVVGDGVALVTQLKQETGKDICIMGGGVLAASLFEADLIDEVGFNIHPVLLGSGVPVFPGLSRQVNLELAECRTLKTGCVYVLYKVKR